MIPDEAVEAALLALCQPDHWMLPDDEAKVRDILEAAAPYMLRSAKAEAWAAGERAGYVNCAIEERPDPSLDPIQNPYRSQA